ncbi:MAG TPA: alpha/beta hydrolase [Acidimicrobiales bacterium]|nr:alpha/beta hydrolase [Acidimicrobiales bacterium]
MFESSDLHTIRLRDGRQLAYSAFGAADGRPLVSFAGVPGSRLYGLPLEPAARELGFRVLTVDLPGAGQSDYKADRTFADTADDISQLADELGLDRFDVLGVAGGAPHALACAWRCGDRVHRLALVNSALPINTRATQEQPRRRRRFFYWAVRTPWANRLAMGVVAWRARHTPRSILKNLESTSSDSDLLVLARPEVRDLFATAAADAFQRGARGPTQEIALLSGYWDIKFREITIPVDVWQGEEDPAFRAESLKWLTDQIPNCNITLVPGAGQLWLIDHADMVLRALTK